MGSFLLVGAGNSNTVWKVGRVGYDSGTAAAFTQDANGAYTATLVTERMSPVGEDGLARFRRVVLRAYKTGTWKVTMTVFVDDVQTKRWDNDEASSTYGTQVNQTIEIESEPNEGTGEAIIEGDIDATGTFVQVQIDIVSTDIQGYFLPESIEVHLQALRESKSRDTAESQ